MDQRDRREIEAAKDLMADNFFLLDALLPDGVQASEPWYNEFWRTEAEAKVAWELYRIAMDGVDAPRRPYPPNTWEPWPQNKPLTFTGGVDIGS